MIAGGGWRQAADRPLVRWGLPVILGLALVHGALILVDYAAAWRAAAADAKIETALAQRLVATPLAPLERADPEAGLWRAPSEGQARARIAARLNESLRAAGVGGAEVRVDGVIALGPDLRRVSAVVAGRFDVDPVERWLAAPVGPGAAVVLDRLRIQAAPAPRFEVALSFPVMLDTTAP